MPTFAIRVDGASGAAASFRQAARRVGALNQPIWRSLLLMERELKIYPPPPPRSTYVRTGRLGSSWNSSVSGNSGILQTNVSYAIWVQNAQHQAWMHRGRWRNTDDAVVRRLEPEIVRTFTDALRAVAA
jgi:hypothetical protein